MRQFVTDLSWGCDWRALPRIAALVLLQGPKNKSRLELLAVFRGTRVVFKEYCNSNLQTKHRTGLFSLAFAVAAQDTSIIFYASRCSFQTVHIACEARASAAQQDYCGTAAFFQILGTFGAKKQNSATTCRPRCSHPGRR